MNTRRPRYHRHRFPPEIISHAVWLYHRYCMSFRDVEDLLAERGIIVSYETVRQWCGKFGPDYARQLKRRQGRLGDTWFLDEVFVTINGQRQYLWRAVDQDGDLIDILVQLRRDGQCSAEILSPTVGCFRHQLLLPRPYLVLTKPLRLDIQCQRGASVKIGWKYLDD